MLYDLNSWSIIKTDVEYTDYSLNDRNSCYSECLQVLISTYVIISFFVNSFHW